MSFVSLIGWLVAATALWFAAAAVSSKARLSGGEKKLLWLFFDCLTP